MLHSATAVAELSACTTLIFCTSFAHGHGGLASSRPHDLSLPLLRRVAPRCHHLEGIALEVILEVDLGIRRWMSMRLDVGAVPGVRR